MLAWSEIIIRLLLASLLGGLIGLERERKDWAAGLRTHMMVSVGSCLIMIVSAFGFADILGTEHVTLDPARVAAQVVSGIGFIGAGTILFLKQGVVRGLTTAAGLWTVAAIGLAVGGGLYLAAIATTVIALIILWALQPLEHVYFKKFKQKTLKIVAYQNFEDNELLKMLLNIKDLKNKSFSFQKNEDVFVYEIKFEGTELKELESLINQLKNSPLIKEIDWV
ncbi:MAG: MgtC/SapB family protein [Bacteroidales bacterium]|nr:MgtC/SapB family protein [Bacteroidales bacterium]